MATTSTPGPSSNGQENAPTRTKALLERCPVWTTKVKKEEEEETVDDDQKKKSASATRTTNRNRLKATGVPEKSGAKNTFHQAPFKRQFLIEKIQELASSRRRPQMVKSSLFLEKQVVVLKLNPAR